MGEYYWVDEDGQPFKIDMYEWASKFSNENRVLSQDEVGDAKVSTVFLGLNHQYGSGPPVLWETLIFGGDWDGHMWRYTSQHAAAIGHVNVVRDLMVGQEPSARTDDG